MTSVKMHLATLTQLCQRQMVPPVAALPLCLADLGGLVLFEFQHSHEALSHLLQTQHLLECWVHEAQILSPSECTNHPSFHTPDSWSTPFFSAFSLISQPLKEKKLILLCFGLWGLEALGRSAGCFMKPMYIKELVYLSSGLEGSAIEEPEWPSFPQKWRACFF